MRCADAGQPETCIPELQYVLPIMKQRGLNRNLVSKSNSLTGRLGIYLRPSASRANDRSRHRGTLINTRPGTS